MLRTHQKQMNYKLELERLKGTLEGQAHRLPAISKKQLEDRIKKLEQAIKNNLDDIKDDKKNIFSNIIYKMFNIKTKNGLRIQPSYEQLMDAIVEGDTIKPKNLLLYLMLIG